MICAFRRLSSRRSNGPVKEQPAYSIEATTLSQARATIQTWVYGSGHEYTQRGGSKVVQTATGTVHRSTYVCVCSKSPDSEGQGTTGGSAEAPAAVETDAVPSGWTSGEDSDSTSDEDWADPPVPPEDRLPDMQRLCSPAKRLVLLRVSAQEIPWSPVGLCNDSQSACYLNSVLQCLLSLAPIRNLLQTEQVCGHVHVASDRAASQATAAERPCTLEHLRGLMRSMAMRNHDEGRAARRPIDQADFYRFVVDNHDLFRMGRHEDAHECWSELVSFSSRGLFFVLLLLVSICSVLSHACIACVAQAALTEGTGGVPVSAGSHPAAVRWNAHGAEKHGSCTTTDHSSTRHFWWPTHERH